MEKVVIIILALVGVLGLAALIGGGVLFAESNKIIQNKIEKVNWLITNLQIKWF